MYQTWEELHTACLACRKCALCQTRLHVVVGVGVPDAEVMFIGEGPGENEDLQGEPFVGRAGVLLDKMLLAVDLDRKKNIYIANIVKCRPPHNRDPKPEEQELCIGWLRNQVKLLRPKIIVCLGRIAAMRIIKPMATLHPAAVLRNPSQKPDAFNDFLLLRDKIKEVCTHTYEQETLCR